MSPFRSAELAGTACGACGKVLESASIVLAKDGAPRCPACHANDQATDMIARGARAESTAGAKRALVIAIVAVCGLVVIALFGLLLLLVLFVRVS